MKLRSYLFLAAISCAALAAAPAWTARRPRYGGNLRIEISGSLDSIDPSIVLGHGSDPVGNHAPSQFDSRNISGNLLSASNSGLFRLIEWESSRRAKFAANGQSPSGRPFADSLEIDLGRSPKERLIDLELGKADLAEIAPEDARRAAESGVRISISKPDELVGMLFFPGRAAVEDIRVRKALALVIDRSSITSFILQKEGEPAGGLLPQWSSGTAFLFHTAADPAAAKEQWSQIGGQPKISLGYDAGDGLEQAIAERIAVNAREGGIPIATVAVTIWPAASSKLDARIIHWRMSSPKPQTALAGFVSTLSSLAGIKANLPPEGATPDAIYACEQSIVSSYRVVPLVWLPQVYGLSSRVRDWNAPGPGETWPLADVWLDDSADSAPSK